MSKKVQERIAGKMIFALSQKGGCGKSFVVRSFVQWGRHEGWPIAVYDGDSGVGTTYRALGTRENGRLLDVQDPLVGAGRYSLRHDLQRQELVNTIAPEPEGDLGIASAAAIFGPLICLGVAALDPQRVPREAGEIGEGLS
ncbi:MULTISPECIES: hypothetical protein [Devosia]|uniref:hypothetical protein n=1 Tax=Devosia TaxID=46913 RepID=UPI000CE975E9|nr:MULTISPECIES: hypothetical protein [Devosia]AVF05103.1 hypothetical protein C4375_16255 [Devosia sp. I507]